MLPVRYLAAAMFAAAVHEMSHILALKAIRVPVNRIEIGPFGAKIYTMDLTPIQEAICAAAGPAGSFLLMYIAAFAPLTAFFGLIQGSFNLIPMFSLDGRRLIHGLMQFCFPVKGKRIAQVLSWIFVAGSVCWVGIKLSWRLVAAVMIFVLIPSVTINNPCKDGRLRVQ